MTREDAYILLLRPTEKELLTTSKKKICSELKKTTGVKANTWNNQRGKLTKSIISRVELAYAKQLLREVLSSEPHVIDKIKEFLEKEK